MTAGRWLLLGLLAGGLALFFALDGQRLLSLMQVQQLHGDLQALRAARPWLVAGGYVAVYVAVAALSLPGSLVLTLLGGALFGVGHGTLLVLLAATAGATLAMLSARYLLRQAVASHLSPRLAEIDRGIARDGAFYLFTVRLVPMIPFFVVNPLVGLTAMPVRTFVVVTPLGMLPCTLIYVNAGTQLALIREPADILSAPLSVSLLLLGLLPLLAARLAAARRHR